MKNNFNSNNKTKLVSLVAIFAILFAPTMIFAYSGGSSGYSYSPSSSYSGGSSGYSYSPSSSYSSYGGGSSGYSYSPSSSYSYGGGSSGYSYSPSYSYGGGSSGYSYSPSSSYSYGGGSSGYSYSPTSSYLNSYLPASNCSGSNCSGSAGTYQYGSSGSGYSYLPTSGGGGCSGSNCGGGGGGGMPSVLGLNLNYSDNDTITTTTTNTCSNGNNATSSGNCNTVNNYVASNDNDDDDDDLEIICRVSDTSIEEGDTVTFEVEIDGGRPSFRIEWDGDISGDDEEERVRFNRRGTYRVSVEVRDANGDRASDDCAVVRVEDEDDDDDDERRVTVTTGTNLNTPSGNLASLDSVFLSQVPYTGPSDILKALGILALIAVWSTAVAMYLKKQRDLKTISNKITNFKEQNKTANKIA